MKRWTTLLAWALLALGLTGCATAQHPDPIEPWNRGVFAVNEALDVALIKPVATVYSDTMPRPVRKGVTNFFNNLRDVWSAINLTLQGRPVDAVSDLARFGTNTVFGVLGVFDVASDLGLERHSKDFGHTLGRWGVGPGAYIVWPLLGPSTLRDSLNIPFDNAFNPASFVTPVSASLATTATGLVNLRANLLAAGNLLDDISIDKYSFVRDGYLQRRRSQIYDGNPPDLELVDGPDDLGTLPATGAGASTQAAPAAVAPVAAPAASSP
ncbi:MAG: VacJ family lipoprotein [Leptothrix sp. (in: b-proteobacteria)]